MTVDFAFDLTRVTERFLVAAAKGKLRGKVVTLTRLSYTGLDGYRRTLYQTAEDGKVITAGMYSRCREVFDIYATIQPV